MRANRLLVMMAFTIAGATSSPSLSQEPSAAANGCLPSSVTAPIAAFGVYEGSRTVAVALDGVRGRPNLVSVVGDRRGPQRILLLMSYSATVWDFTHAPANRIRGVIVSGHYAQAVANLPAHIPVAFSSSAPGVESCGGPGYAYDGGPDLDVAVSVVEAATGAEVTSFGGAYAASAAVLTDVLTPSADAPTIGAGPVRAAVAVTETDPLRTVVGGARLELEDDRSWSGTPPVWPELAALIEQGAVRPAQWADIETWNASVTARLRTRRLAPFRSENLHPVFAYVVLAPITLPESIIQKQFIVPLGVPAPRTENSHNTIYFVESGTCSGARSECSDIEYARRMRADTRYHCEGARRSIETVQPIGAGPARLVEVLCTRSPSHNFLPLISRDARYMARINDEELSVASLRPMSPWSVWSGDIARSFNILERAPPVRWDDAGQSIWVARQHRIDRGRWAAAAVEIVRVRNGNVRDVGHIRGAPGRLDALQWVGDGVAIAQFDTRGETYRPELENANPTIAFIDARRRRVLDAMPLAELESMAGREMRHAPLLGGVLLNGRARAVIEARGRLIVWTEGEQPYAIESNFDRFARPTLAPDGASLLVNQMLRVEGMICERAASNVECPPPEPRTGVWAARYDLRDGRAIWQMNGTATTFAGRVGPPAISANGRLALLQLPTSDRQELALVDMGDGAVLQRFTSASGFGFTDDDSVMWIEYGGLLAFYRLQR